MGRSYGYRGALSNMHYDIFGEEIKRKSLHDALYDAKLCADIYWSIVLKNGKHF
jgi:DNA polymerase III epsilon subunit-like protein